MKKTIKIASGLVPFIGGFAISLSIKQHNTEGYIVAGIIALLLIFNLIRSISEDYEN